MRAARLAVVFVAAKLLMLSGRELPCSVWTPIAFLWQDLAFVLAFAVCDRLMRRAAPGWIAYAMVCGYVALNVPVARATSSPLTWAMLRAADAALADSIKYFVTWTNIAAISILAALAIVLPLGLRRANNRLLLAGACCIAPLVALGPLAGSRIDTIGLDRNVFVLLAATTRPRISAAEAEEDWRLSPFAPDSTPQASELGGIAAGRNVLFVVLESAAAQYLRPYGAAEDPMPNLSRLASQGLLVENAYAVYPESIKGIYAILSSAYPAIDTEPAAYANLCHPSLPAVLAEADYCTGLFHSGRFEYLGMQSMIQDRGYQLLEDAGQIGGKRESSFGIDERSTVRRILGWIDGARGKRPFFVTYLPVAGHHPYETPEPGPFPEREEIDRYRNALHYADQALGMLLAGLRKRGLLRQTLVVVCGDHGQAFGQHAGNYGHTLFLYEENVRVPLVIAAPGAFDGPLRIQSVTSHIDVAPTILALLGLPTPACYQGRPLWDSRNHMALCFTDYSLALLGLRDGRWKFIYQWEGRRSKLFDLASDPEETTDLAPRYSLRAATYRDRLLRWSATQRNLVVKADN